MLKCNLSSDRVVDTWGKEHHGNEKMIFHFHYKIEHNCCSTLLVLIGVRTMWNSRKIMSPVPACQSALVASYLHG